ncbi:voltage-dependent calcium channel gamma-6 subunit-like isoform X3 [Sebastes umbrosus]|uniref:voltage-dependent calcium channel gamma-6 subunit-like isoform X3 n=1 Tax=Sebastes umbrosus TaxID=72105 RepID=UPI00189D5148|nr:voltage-dependent calcium channel gamma-6 subunit-like isoform X3 [Sebastes umbrosus]
MWSTFFVTDEEGRTIGPAVPGTMAAPGGAPQGAGGLTGLMTARGNKRRRTTSTGHAMSEAQEGKIKLAFFVAIVGVVLTVLGMGTEFWVELAPPKSYYNNQTCLTAHYGLWKGCTKTLWVSDIDPERESCGPAELPGESNCTYFKFFTTGENLVLFQKTTQKSVLVLISLIVFHQSVLAFLASDHTVPLHHELSWSVSCIGCAGGVLIVGGILFLLLALPYSPWRRCLPQRDSSS